MSIRNGSIVMNVKKYLAERNVPFDVLEHVPTYDASRLARAVHVSGFEVAKTVLLRINRGRRYVVAILPATHSIELAKVKTGLGSSKVDLASEMDILRHCPDCGLGVLPFGEHYGMTTIVDESLADDDRIVFEGNTHDEAIRMKYDDFYRLAEPLVFRFAQPYQASAKARQHESTER